MISKLSIFNSFQDFQIDFKSILSKLYKSGKPFPKDLQIVAFLYGVEEIYSQWAFIKQSTIRGKKIDDSLPTVNNLTVELMDKLRTNIQAKVIILKEAKSRHNQTYGQENSRRRRRRGKEGGAPAGLQRSKLKCIHCKLQDHLEEFCWKKYTKKAPNRNKFNKSLSKKD